MKLYYRAGTGRPFRVAWALEEIGVEYEAVGLTGDSSRARNPLGQVPVVEFDDGETLFDSTAILLQIADLFPDAGLIGPVGSLQRGQAYQWCLAGQTELEKAAVNARRDYDVPTQRDNFAAAAAALAAALDGHRFLVADRFGVADIVVVGALLIGGRVGWLDDAQVTPPRVAEYLSALRARPAFARSQQRTESIFR